MALTVETATFVTASEAFDGLGALRDVFDESRMDWVFGSNDRTLVSSSGLLTHLRSELDGEPEDSALSQQLLELEERIRAADPQYIDLES
jgi:hypothetical protein